MFCSCAPRLIREIESDESVDGELPGNFGNRFLEVCLDGDVEDLVQLFEEMARIGAAITPDLLNNPDGSGRVS